MFVLEPIFHHTIWGGSRFVNVYGKTAEKTGHLYSVRSKAGCSNSILNDKYAGLRLYNVMGEFPLSIALVDANESLSIQVHPGGEQAKHESYFFLDAPKEGYIYCGMENTPKSEMFKVVNESAVLPAVKRVFVKSGDYIKIEPGTVHALTAGSFVYEIEQGEDITYRLYDYNRTDENNNPRELHAEEAAAVTDTSLIACSRVFLPNTVIREKNYAIQFLSNVTEYENTDTEFKCLTLISGNISADNIEMTMGMSVLLERGEGLNGINIDKAIVAWPRGDEM